MFTANLGLDFYKLSLFIW